MSHSCWIFDIDGVLTDPQSKKIVDHYLFDQLATWLKTRQLDITHFYTFGDSQSDIDMAKKIHEIYGETKQITFIYVGPHLHWKKQDLKFPIHHYPGFNKGTVKFLNDFANPVSDI